MFFPSLKLVKHRSLATLAFYASVFALVVIALGALTRLMDAGLGCPDWPFCYGQMVMPFNNKHLSSIWKFSPASLVLHKAWIEMIHRYFVFFLSLFILGMISLIFLYRTLRTQNNKICAFMLILLFLYQIILGKWTVTYKLLPFIVIQHLLGGYFILTTLWWLYLSNRFQPNNKFFLNKSTGLTAWIGCGLLILLVQIFFGAATSTHYAALSCNHFPLCTSTHFFPLDFRTAFIFKKISLATKQTLQMCHRLGALLFTLYFIVFIFFNRKLIHGKYLLQCNILIIFSLLLLQILLGLCNILFNLPLLIAIFHTLTAALLWLSMITFLFIVTRQSYEF